MKPLPMWLSANFAGVFNLLPVTSKSSSLSVYFSFCLLVYSVSSFHPDYKGAMVITLGSLVQLRAVGREEHWEEMSLACVGNARSFSCFGYDPTHEACVLS